MRVPGLVIHMAVFVIGLILFHWLERRYPIQAAQTSGPKRRGYFADLAAAFVNGPFLGTLTKIGAANVLIMLPVFYDAFGGWPWWLQFAIFLLYNDFMRYWLHRWYHESDLLWRIHRVHHTCTEMDALSTFRVHLLEAVIKYGVIMTPFYVLMIDPTVIIVYTTIDILKGFWHHANVRTVIGSWNYVLNSAELHWWHHAVDGPGQYSNYGSIFSIWDRLFGTFYYPRCEWPKQVGVEGMEAFPDTYTGQFATVCYDDDGVRRKYCGSSRPIAEDGAAPPAQLPPDSPARNGRGALKTSAGRGLA